MFSDSQTINCVLDKEEMPQKWKECIIAPIYKKGDKTACLQHFNHYSLKVNSPCEHNYWR